MLGTAFMPGILWFFWALEQTSAWEPMSRAWAVGLSLALAYLIFGFSLIAVAVMITRILPKMKPGEYKFASPQGAQWFFTGALSFLVSKFFLDFLFVDRRERDLLSFDGGKDWKKLPGQYQRDQRFFILSPSETTR